MALGKRVKTYKVTIPTESITSVEAFKYHKKRKKSPLVTDIRVYRKIVRAIWNEVITGMVEEKDGVCLKGWGYFYIIMNPKRRIGNMGGKKFLNPHTNGHLYYPVLDSTLMHRHKFSGWHLDSAFTRRVTRPMAAKLMAGWKYFSNRKLAAAMLKQDITDDFE